MNFDPLVRAIKLATPYAIAAIAVASLSLPLITSRFHILRDLILDSVGRFFLLCSVACIILIVFTQIRDQPYSFGELLPSSAFVALMMSVGLLLFQRSNESFGAGIGVFALLVSLAVFSPSIAAVLFGFPRIPAASHCSPESWVKSRLEEAYLRRSGHCEWHPPRDVRHERSRGRANPESTTTTPECPQRLIRPRPPHCAGPALPRGRTARAVVI